MCGIYGWQLQTGAMKKSQLNIVAAVLSSENDRRGGDSWGVSVLDQKNLQTNRGLGMVSKGVKAYRLSDHLQVMAHTRKASTGAITVENAHPYQIGRVLGAHNGCIYNYRELNSKYRRECAVDSMHIFHHLRDRLDLQELKGWGAIEYIRTDEPSAVFLGRFHTGELAVRGLGTKVKDSTGLVWSSDGRALEKALSLAGVRSFEYKIDKETLYKAFKGILHQDGILPVSTSDTLTSDQRRQSEATGTFRGEGSASLHSKPGTTLLKKSSQKGLFTCGICNDESQGECHRSDTMLVCDECWNELEEGEA